MRSIVALSAMLVLFHTVRAQDCTDRVLLEPVDKVSVVHLDTTGHWWAISRPFENFMGLIVDGRPWGPYEAVVNPVFSADGSNFVAGVKVLGQWVVRTATDSIALQGDILYSTFFAGLSNNPWWVHGLGSDIKLSGLERSFQCATMPQSVTADPSGLILAWVEQRGDMYTCITNGVASSLVDEVYLGGVMQGGLVVRAVRIGQRWTVYAGTTELMTDLTSVSQLTVNTSGTACAWVGSDGSRAQRAYCWSEEMREPWTSLPLENARGLVISPHDALVAVKGIRNGNSVVVFNGAEYPTGAQSGPLSFSTDGQYLVYAGVDGDNFVTINGKRHWLRGGVNLQVPVHINKAGTAVGWGSSTTLAYVNLEHNALRLGKMCDTMGPVIYDRRAGVFRGLGFVSGRLFLLTCDPR